jgi:quercetin dioxygenase-like cupin family protein
MTEATERLIRRSDMVSCETAFIDCKHPGSMPKENYSIIGPGVTTSEDQVVNLPEPHGFNIGAAAMPNGITNNLHVHYTAEVFIIFKGEWLFRWGLDGKDGEFIGREGDILSMPTWMFRGFTNIGPDDGWIFTSLGQDDTGGVIWDPKVLRGAAEHGLYLTKDNILVDTASGASPPAPEDRIQPLSEAHIAMLRRVSPEEMRGRVTTADDRRFLSPALLDGAIEGHGAALAAVIGPGMSQHRDAAARVTNPHGFSVEWMRIEPGAEVGPFRIAPKQVLILKSGSLRVGLGDGNMSWAEMAPYDVFATPGDAWRRFAAGNEGAELVVVTGGDGRPAIEWNDAIVEAAKAAGSGVDPNGYLAPAELLPPPVIGAAPDAVSAASAA